MHRTAARIIRASVALAVGGAIALSGVGAAHAANATVGDQKGDATKAVVKSERPDIAVLELDHGNGLISVETGFYNLPDTARLRVTIDVKGSEIDYVFVTQGGGGSSDFRRIGKKGKETGVCTADTIRENGKNGGIAMQVGGGCIEEMYTEVRASAEAKNTKGGDTSKDTTGKTSYVAAD